MKTWTIEEAQRDYLEGKLAGAAILFHGMQFNVDECWFTVSIAANSNGERLTGLLVSATSVTAIEFQTITGAYRAIRQIGFLADRLLTASEHDSTSLSAPCNT